jgi:hypothetical protein
LYARIFLAGTPQARFMNIPRGAECFVALIKPVSLKEPSADIEHFRLTAK